MLAGFFQQENFIAKIHLHNWYSPYKANWRIPKLTLKTCTISFNALNYVSIFQLVLMSFESYVKYRE